MAEAMKTEVNDSCNVCGERTDDVATLEEHDAALQSQTPLRTQFMALSQNKRLPGGAGCAVCGSCVSRAVDAFNFQSALSAARPAPLSARIEALRHKLLQLSRRIDVFLVVGDAGQAGQVGHEHEVIMVDRAALEAAADARSLQPATDTRGDHVYQCTMCPQSFHKVSELSAHTRTHPADAAHSCWTCGEQFTTRAACVQHGAAHSKRVCAACGAVGGADEGTCNACSAPLPAARPQRHYVCGYDGCILRFATRNNLLSHIRKMHGAGPGAGEDAEADVDAAEEGSGVCSVCHRTFSSAAALARHARSHHKAYEKAEPHARTDTVEVEYLEVEELEEVLPDVKPELLML